MLQLLSWLLAPMALAAAPLGPVPQMPEVHLAMDDQFEHHHDVGRYRGDVVVFLFGERPGAEAIHRLTEQLFVQFHPTARGIPMEKAKYVPIMPVPGFPPGTRAPEVHLIHVDCAGKEGPVRRAMVREQLRLFSSNEPIWIDFEDRFKDEFGLVPGLANLIVVDARGRLRYHLAGPLDDTQYVGLVQWIQGLRAEAMSKP